MVAGRLRVCIYLLLLVKLITIFMAQTAVAEVDDLDSFVETVGDAETGDETNNEYNIAEPTDRSRVYFYENFDDPDSSKRRWIVSRAQKEDQEGSKYEGIWEFQLPQKVIFGNDRALVLKSKAKHSAISSKLDRPFEFKTKPLFIQYEVNFQNGIDCGGAYIKLLSQSNGLDLAKFTDKTPYTIMFGPDKCGNDYKLHFIFRHKNPLTGKFEEKHAAKPSNRLEDNYSDKKPHSYLLKLFPDNTFQVYVDGALVNNGHLLEDMTPPVNPPMEISDEADKKPADWDDREKIVDLTSKKPDDWDEDAPELIPDPSAKAPDGWLEDVESILHDESAKKPDDWDESMDGVWELPKINNPACANAPGCGPWPVPQIANPAYKGPWKPMISNPDYKGKWTPRMIPNPKYFDDKEPFKMTSIGAVGIEIWAMTDLILFDNFIITDSESELQDWNAKTFDLKKRIMDKDSEGVFSRIFNYTNAHPWLWAVYLLVIVLPLVLILTFCCGGSQEKREEARSKKTDEYVEDDEPSVNNAASPSNGGSRSGSRSRSTEKEDLELDAGGMGDVEMKDEDEHTDVSETDPYDNIVDSQAETDSDPEADTRYEEQVTTTSSLQKKRSRRVD